MRAAFLIVLVSCNPDVELAAASCAPLLEHSAPRAESHARCIPRGRGICFTPRAASLAASLTGELAAWGMESACAVRVDLEGGDGYSFTADEDCNVTIRSSSHAHQAMHALAAAVYRGSVPASLEDAPAFSRRGVIEGFYNRYFSPVERRTTLRLMHQLDQNSYLYAPKDDAFAGYRWREPYPDGSALRAAASEAAQLGIDFFYGISPTLATNGHGSGDFRFTSDEDFAALVQKLDSLRALGVVHFAVLFDDAALHLVHDEDRAAFAGAAAAHADLANRLNARFGPLWVVPAFYNSQLLGGDHYLDDLGANLDGDIEVMWTGSTTWSPTIAPGNLAAVNHKLGRKVLLWDNWPLSAEPVSGRDAELYGSASGILTNATLVGDFGHSVADFWRVLGPLADYSWNPGAYDAATSFSRWQSALPTALGCAR